MTTKQALEEERQAKRDQLERGGQKFTLELTADELDWLLFEILETAATTAHNQNKRSKELDIRHTINQLWGHVEEQGYKP